jgi:C4-dicarboxylate-specific signal transduction histidine kinase
VKISLIYALCWVLFSIFFDKPLLFSMDHQVQHAALDFMAGLLYLTATTCLVFMLMKNQEQRIALLKSKIEIAEQSLESRVEMRTAELEEAFGALKRLEGIIPICANCKDIRNESGQWEKIEAYKAC